MYPDLWQGIRWAPRIWMNISMFPLLLQSCIHKWRPERMTFLFGNWCFWLPQTLFTLRLLQFVRHSLLCRDECTNVSLHVVFQSIQQSLSFLVQIYAEQIMLGIPSLVHWDWTTPKVIFANSKITCLFCQSQRYPNTLEFPRCGWFHMPSLLVKSPCKWP